ncbi:MAG TPA: P1 family peptidase [Terriglobales bacterium]|nr:P1 family peptidase [Terriglobales bacterium]
MNIVSRSLIVFAAFSLMSLCAQTGSDAAKPKPRARDLGIPFDGSPGKLNAITDLAGVEVGYTTLISGEGKRVIGKGPVRTGVTAILPRGKTSGEGVFAAYFSGNGNGDMTGTHWVEESGVLETPIVITNTLSVGVVRDATVDWMVKRDRPGPFWYPVVAETSDGRLNDMKGQHVTKEHTLQALNSAQGGAIAEGNVGGGTGMLCNGFKGGTGTSSRIIPNEQILTRTDRMDASKGPGQAAQNGYTVGVLVQCNYGGRSGVRIAGIPVGDEIVGHQPCVAKQLDPPALTWNGKPAPLCESKIASARTYTEAPEQGSIIVVVGTDAPLTPDQLKRLARRVALGLGRMGGLMGNGSGDIFIAFSTANAGADDGNSTEAGKPAIGTVQRLRSERIDPLFAATVQAVEESITNAMIAAETMTGADYWRHYAIPHDQLQKVLRKYNRLQEKR